VGGLRKNVESRADDRVREKEISLQKKTYVFPEAYRRGQFTGLPFLIYKKVSI